MTPNDRKYTKTHEWLKIEGNLAIVGITDHAQSTLGDVTYIDVKAVGTFVEQGGECGVIESVKAASDIFAPVDGEIAEKNQMLELSPELLNTDPYGKGWILKFKNTNSSQLASLLSSSDYDVESKSS